MPRGGKVPRWVYDAIRRGLSPQAPERWPSMVELLGALARDPARRRRRWLAAAAGSVALGGLAVIAAAPRDADEPLCQDAPEQLAGIWDGPRRDDVQRALQRTALSYAAPTFTRVAERLDDYAERWVHMHTESCEATVIRRVQSEALLDLRMQCLRRRRLRLEAAVDVLADADAEVAKTAIQQVAALPSIDACADTEALTAAVAPPQHPQVARAVERMRDDLQRIEALTQAARYDDAHAQVDALAQRSHALDYPPLEAEVLRLSAEIARHRGDYPLAETHSRRAYALAVRHGLDAVAADAASTMMFVTGHYQAKIEVGRAWGVSARALAQRSDPSGVKEAMVINGLGVIAYRDGDFSLARDYFEQALPMLTEALDENDQRVALNLNHLGVMLDEQGRFTEAEPHFRRALRIQTEVFGPEHPRRTASMDNLALCLQAQGRNDEARDIHLEAIELRRRALGPEHPDLALTYNNLGWDYMGLHDPQAASVHFDRAREIFEAAFGTEHPRVAMAVESMAIAKSRLQRYDEAEALHRRALEIRRASLGERHPNVALSLSGLGEVARMQERYPAAIELGRQALAILDDQADGAERYLTDVLTELGQSMVAAAQFTEARAHLERALRLHGTGAGTDPVVLAELYLYLAQAHAGEGDRRAAARAAREGHRQVAPLERDEAVALRDKLAPWLTETPE